MRYDVVLVINDAINSVKACIKSLAKVEYDKKLINIILVDNTSVAETTQMLCSLKQDNNYFGGLEIIQSQKNKGVSFANNQGANCGSSPFVFFLNVNAQVGENLFLELDGAIEKNQNATAFECRCLPFETTSHIDPVTLEKTLADMRALVIKKDVFVSVGGFDRHLEGQCAVADLSWQICAVGAKIQYVPTASVTFLAVENDEDRLFPYIMKHYETLLLNYKYANFAKILKAEKAYINEIKRPLHFENVRKELLKKYLKHFCTLWHFLFYRFNFDNRAKLKKCEFKTELLTDRGREKLEPFSENPLVSVVIRTYNKKDYLRLALTSIANQTYKNIEVIVAEDGEDTAQEMLKKEFSHLNIKYINDGVRKGRGANGNAGLKAASGEYCMFLDDDDLFYPEHIDLFVSKAMDNKNADMVLGSAMAMFVKDEAKPPYPYSVVQLKSMVFDRIDIFNMCQNCRIPIQTVLFKRSLYTEYGGLHEGIQANEDWAMWLKYLAHAKRINNTAPDITRMTSLFLQPSDPQAVKARIAKYQVEDTAFYNDENIRFDVSLKDMRDFYKGVLADFEHLQNQGNLSEFITQAREKYK